MALVEMTVADELLDRLPDALPLLKARERDRQPATDHGYTIVTLEVDNAPAGARRVKPTFQRTADGDIQLLTVTWYTD
ncbi:hypothetical protein [Streptomyces lavendofoliae]|uniref:Uncharacterized protein n=1 Tax=Streptomyces lavendofoliae TaxID=67314 RepID=A0A918I3A9_9ACTN|nr:hypothetical protein [Streptomyces lavendofoliae]GGU62724.1 hypothetical protein GCM10010274_59430 [Streptomyces lavendofoliae]